MMRINEQAETPHRKCKTNEIQQISITKTLLGNSKNLPQKRRYEK